MFCPEWSTAFQTAASAAGLSFTDQETEPRTQPAGTTLVTASVSDDRHLTSGARSGFGTMTGNAFINAEADFIEMPSQRPRRHAASSTAWQGLFSAMTDRQVAALSDEIVCHLK